MSKKFWGDVAAALAKSFFTALLRGWMLWIAGDLVHDHWIPQGPEIRYWLAALLCFVFPIAASGGSKGEGQ